MAFRITLHIDDIKVLYTIKDYLGIGTVRANSTYAIFSIGKVQDILTVLLPFLYTYTLHTTKYLDYLDFKIIVKLLNSSLSSNLNNNNLGKVKLIIAGMNSTISKYDYS